MVSERIYHAYNELTIHCVGVRNYVGRSSIFTSLRPLCMRGRGGVLTVSIIARNNMRSMVKGDQAFFYHSNCKVPGIVGIMEIVQEHSVDGKRWIPMV